MEVGGRRGRRKLFSFESFMGGYILMVADGSRVVRSCRVFCRDVVSLF